MRELVKAMKDEDGIPILPRKINFPWPTGERMKSRYSAEKILWPDYAKLAIIGRRLKTIRKYTLTKQEIKYIYQMKTK